MGQLTFAFLLYVMCLWTSMQIVNGALCYAYSNSKIYSFYCGEVCCDSYSPGDCCKWVYYRTYYKIYYYNNYYTDYTNNSTSSGLSTSTTTGLVIGCITGLLCLLYLVFACCKCNRQKTARPANQQTLRPTPTLNIRSQLSPDNSSTYQTGGGLELSVISGRVPEQPPATSEIFPQLPAEVSGRTVP